MISAGPLLGQAVFPTVALISFVVDSPTPSRTARSREGMLVGDFADALPSASNVEARGRALRGRGRVLRRLLYRFCLTDCGAALKHDRETSLSASGVRKVDHSRKSSRYPLLGQSYQISFCLFDCFVKIYQIAILVCSGACVRRAIP